MACTHVCSGCTLCWGVVGEEKGRLGCRTKTLPGEKKEPRRGRDAAIVSLDATNPVHRI
jgi:hypothetical protein